MLAGRSIAVIPTGISVTDDTAAFAVFNGLAFAVVTGIVALVLITAFTGTVCSVSIIFVAAIDIIVVAVVVVTSGNILTDIIVVAIATATVVDDFTVTMVVFMVGKDAGTVIASVEEVFEVNAIIGSLVDAPIKSGPAIVTVVFRTIFGTDAADILVAVAVVIPTKPIAVVVTTVIVNIVLSVMVIIDDSDNIDVTVEIEVGFDAAVSEVVV